jgi:hypothetical protein
LSEAGGIGCPVDEASDRRPCEFVESMDKLRGRMERVKVPDESGGWGAGGCEAECRSHLRLVARPRDGFVLAGPRRRPARVPLTAESNGGAVCRLLGSPPVLGGARYILSGRHVGHTAFGDRQAGAIAQS